MGHKVLVNYTTDTLETLAIKSKDTLEVYQKIPYNSADRIGGLVRKYVNLPRRVGATDHYILDTRAFHSTEYLLEEDVGTSGGRWSLMISMEVEQKCRKTHVGYLCPSKLYRLPTDNIIEA